MAPDSAYNVAMRPIALGRSLFGACCGVAAALALVAACVGPTQSSKPVSPSPAVSPSLPVPTATAASSGASSEFPDHVLGMPVLSIKDVTALIASGSLDGRAVAVAGYWIQMMVPSCPAPDRWYSVLEPYCGISVVSDTPFAGAWCTPLPNNGSECGGNTPPPGSSILEPVMVDAYPSMSGGPNDAFSRYPNGVPMALIGHVADPRYIQCRTESEATCRSAFVADTVAWEAGADIPVAAYQDPNMAKPRMTVAQIQSLLGTTDLISLSLTTARQAADFDPRLNLVGDDLVWVGRSLRGGGDASGSTRAVDAWAISDKTGVVDHLVPLELGASYKPGFFSPQGVDLGYDMAGSSLQSTFRIETSGGVAVHEGLIGGWMTSGIDGSNVGARFYPGAPVVLDPGDYTVHAWHTPISSNGITWGASTDECADSITLTSGQTVRLEAAFPAKGACTWRDPTFPASLY